MKRTYLLFFIVLLLAMSCSIFNSNEPEEMGLEKHRVVIAVLDSLMSHVDSTNIYNYTTGVTDVSGIRTLMNRDAIVRDLTLLSNYSNTNLTAFYFDETLLPEHISLEEVDSSAVYTGYWLFTCPGFSNNGKWAIVEFSRISAPLSGGGSVAMLKKENDEWQLVWIEMTWIS